jgi:ABC-2 type transport system permease protein
MAQQKVAGPRRGMLIRRTWAVARKELRHITRNRLTLFLVTLTPAMLLVTLSYVFSFNIDQADLGVMDLDRSPASRAFVAGLTSGPSLQLVALAADYDDIQRLLVGGTVNAVLVIAPGFADSVAAGQPAPLQVVVDGSNSLIAGQVINMVTSAARSVAGDLTPEIQAVAAPWEVRSRAWYNDTLKARSSMIPGLMAIVLTLPALALSLSLTREKELGTLEGLMATPMENTAYLVGKMSAYLVTGLGGLLLCWLVATAWFQVPFRGSLGLLFLVTCAYFGATMGFSLFISTWIDSQQAAMFIVMVVFFVPSFFVTGLIDPINPANRGAVLMSSFLPATHYITLTRGLFLKGLGLQALVVPCLVLAGMTLVALLSSIAMFKKRLG